MEKMTLKGNYFDGAFIQNKTNINSQYAYCHLIKKAPYNLDLTLWQHDIYYDDIDSIVESAQNGFLLWRSTTQDKRISYLKKYQKALMKNKEKIANSIACETGKPYWEALTEASALISKVDITINDSLARIEKIEIENIAANTNAQVTCFPTGPSLIIGPFNFPCHLANTQILASLIAGNSIIFKPSEKTCYSGQMLIECFHQAGFPNGVINLVQGNGESVSKLLKYKQIKNIFFTGSKEVGMKILEKTYKDLSKQVSLELGGKNTTIVDNNVNMDYVLEELKTACFLTAGQRCTSTAFVLVDEKIKDQFISKMHEMAKKIVVGSPFATNPESFMGPLIDQKSVDNYLLYMGMAKRENMEEIMRGKQLERETDGYFVSPSIHFAHKYDSESHFLKNEIFGPNCTILGYQDLEQAVQIANYSEYGLAASIFTRDKAKFEYSFNNLESGIVNWNRSTCGAHARLPFGGIKNSGNYHPAAVSSIDYSIYKKVSLKKEMP